MTIIIHKKAYYTADKKQIGPVEVYDKDHKFVGISQNKKLILGRKENGYFVAEGKDFQIKITLGDRLMFQNKKEGIACYVGYNEKAEQETQVGFLIWKEDLSELYAHTPITHQSKIKKVWQKIVKNCEYQMGQG